LGVVAIVLWYLFATNKPEENKFISDKEVEYLHRTIGVIHQQEGRKVYIFKICANDAAQIFMRKCPFANVHAQMTLRKC
jgi:hypothetical protein